MQKEAQSTSDKKTQHPSTFDILATTMSGSVSPNSGSPTSHTNAVTDTNNSLSIGNTPSVANDQHLMVNSR
jgi:hypothetical protein